MSDTANPVPPARNLAIFLDGTTDIAMGNTNVWRLKSLCDAAPDSGQLVFYSAGVGTSFGEKLRGGVFGYGIDDVVAQAYLWLMENYRDNDNIFIFGFSRGAYTARSLAGLISRCGVIKLGAPISIQQLYARYQQGNHMRTVHQLCEPGVDPAACSQEERWMIRYCRAADILFTGVWDTVGAVATDDKFAFITGGDHTFLDVNLRQTEKNVYHAVAIDENRLVFDANLLTQYVPGTDAAALWTSPRPLDQVEQRWFAGSHGNVGGGSYNDLLAQLPLRWLMSKAQAHRLKFRFPLDVDDGAGMGAIDDSFKAFLNGAMNCCSWSSAIGDRSTARRSGIRPRWPTQSTRRSTALYSTAGGMMKNIAPRTSLSGRRGAASILVRCTAPTSPASPGLQSRPRPSRYS